MNRKQLFFLILAGVVIGGVGLMLSQKRSASWQTHQTKGAPQLLGTFPINDVTQIVIRQASNQLNLVKGETIWQVRERGNYPANFSQISELVRKLAELKPVQSVKVGPSQFGRLELLDPGKGTNSGTLLELKDKGGKVLAALLLGKKHMRGGGGGDDSPFGGGGGWPDGRFVTIPAHTPASVWIVADALATVETKPDSWLNKDFVKVEKLKTISSTSTNAAAPWKFTRETESGDLKLADRKEGEEPDANKIVSLVNVLSYASFNDVLTPDAKPEATGLDHPVEVKIETFDQFAYDLKIGKAAADDNYHLTFQVSANFPTERTAGPDEKPEDKAKLDKEFKDKLDKLKAKLEQEKACEKWIYLVSKWTIDNLLKDRSQWMADKKDSKKNDAAADTSEPHDPSTATPPIPGVDPEDKDEEDDDASPSNAGGTK